MVAPDYRIAYWDSQTEFLAGISAEKAVGKHCYEVVLGEQENGERFCSWGCSVMRMSQEDRPVVNYDILVPSTSGNKRWVNVSTLSLDCDGGIYLVHLMRYSQLTKKGSDTSSPARRTSRP